MPYFERGPWQETVGRQAKADAVAARDDLNIIDLAESVLSSESRQRQVSGGPFRCRKTVSPGGRGVVILNVAADENGGPLTLDLSPGDLRERSGQVIPANLVQIEPAHLEIPPGGNQALEVHVLVPHTTGPGLFSGRVVGDGPEPISFVVEFIVVRTVADQTSRETM